MSTPPPSHPGRRWARLYLLVASLVVAALALLTPPFQVPDEQQHFFRAYQLSESHLLAARRDGRLGGDLPVSLIAFAAAFLGRTTPHGQTPVVQRPLRDLLAPAQPLDPDIRAFADFTGAAPYWPPVYLPQAAAIAVGRAAGLGPAALLLAARLANGFAAALLTAFAFSRMPVAHAALLVFALLPMTLYQFASCSPDALTIATATLFTAAAAAASADRAWTPARLALAALSSLVFIPLKPVYLPVLLLGLPSRFPRNRRAVAFLLALSLVATLVWALAAPPAANAPTPDISPAQQLRLAIRQPLPAATAMLRSAWNDGLLWLEQMIGQLGWLTVRLPAPMRIIPILALAVAALRAGPPCPLPRLWPALLAAASAAILVFALYLIWTPVGADHVEGVQGRYLLPLIAPLALAADGALPLLRARAAPILIASMAVGEALLTVLVVVQVFRPF